MSGLRFNALMRGFLSVLDTPLDRNGIERSQKQFSDLSPPPKVRILSDDEAMAADFQAVGDDIRAAMGKYEQKHT